MVLQCVVHCPLTGCGSQIRKTSLPTSLGTGIASKLTSMLPDQIVWQPYEVELEDLLSWCIAGRVVWMATVPPICFHLVELHTPNRVVRQFGMIQEILAMLTLTQCLMPLI